MLLQNAEESIFDNSYEIFEHGKAYLEGTDEEGYYEENEVEIEAFQIDNLFK